MASVLFNSFWYDVARGNINVANDTFYVMLVGSGYTPAKSHAKRSDITSEVTGTNYTAGGAATTATLAVDNSGNKVTISFSSASCSASCSRPMVR